MSPRVLITRAWRDAAPLAQALDDLGLESVCVPLIACQPIPGALEQLGDEEFDLALLTSVEAVEPLAAAFALGLPEIERIYAVGSATADAARLAGMDVHPLPQRYTAAHVIDAMGVLFDRGVLWPCAEEPTPETRELLLARQANLVQIPVYRNITPYGAAERLQAALPVDAIPFFSSSAATRFIELSGQVGDALVVAIGPSTAARCAELGMERVVVAEPHNQAGVIEALRAHLLGDSAQG